MPALEPSPTVHATVVCDRREPAPGIVILGVRASELAANVRPGQFVMVLPPSGERVATALGVYEASDDRVSLMLVVVGPRTRELSSLGVGDAIELAGPLGNGFDLDALGNDVALVAGGVGIAPLLLPAQRLLARGARVRLYYGARTSSALVDAELFESFGASLSLATDDGSRGHHGYVTDPLLRDGAAHTGIAACGPSPMLRAVSRVAQTLGVPAQLSLEETFACGVGACWGCVVAHGVDADGVASGLIATKPPSSAVAQASDGRPFAFVRICKEGPVFWAHELRW
jgi:dihydroorotate dehydrogenase electron transfer subunit